MRKRFLIAVGLVISSAAYGQEWKPAVEKWRSCGDAAAARYSRSSESAQEVARLAALACHAEKKQATQAVSKVEGVSFASNLLKRPNAIILIGFLSTSLRCGSMEQKSANAA
jgi:hypothetical protein